MSRYNITENISISAGAGTGKTFTLARRYVNLLLGFEFFNDAYSDKNKFNEKNAIGRKAMPHEIVTMTYTEAAASEMRDRINGLISEIINATEGKPGKDETIINALAHYSKAVDFVQKVLKECQVDMIYSHISTIHSFSLGIVRAYSDLMALDLSPEVISEDERNILFNETLHSVITAHEDTFFEIIDDIGTFKLNAVARKYMSDAKFRRTVKNFIDRSLTLKAIHELYARFVVTMNMNLFQDAIRLLDELEEYAKNPENYKKYRAFFIECIESVIDPDKGFPETVRIFNVLDDGKELRDEFQNGCLAKIMKLRHPHDDNAEAAFNKALSKVHFLLEQVYKKYMESLKAMNRIDFDIIINTAYELIMEGKARPDIRYFMIDEFQDTNEVQWDMFSKLAGLNNANVFLVGDEKQSIYSFQGAEVQVFRKACSDIRATSIPLAVNFRSEKVILDFVNDCCGPIMTAEKVPGKIIVKNPALRDLMKKVESLRMDSAGPICYNPLEPESKRKARHDGTVTWLTTPPFDPGEASEEDIPENDKLEYKNIARFINKISRGDLEEYRDITDLIRQDKKAIAILFDSGAGMDMLKEELLARGIVPTVRADGNLYEAKEVQEIFLALRLISGFYDKTEWKYIKKFFLAGALRSSVFRLDDGDVFDIFAREDVDLVRELVRDLAQAKDVMSISDLIAYIIDRYDLKTVYRHLDDYEQRAANLEKLIQVAQKFEADNGTDLKRFVEELERLIFIGGSEEGTALYEAPGRNSVRLSTIHSVKGLEYPMVIFVQCLKNLKSQQGREIFKHASVLMDDGFHSTMGFITSAGRPVSYSMANAVSGIQHMEEKKRLLYVALTRAEKHLVISVPPLEDEVSENSYLGFLTTQYRENFINIINDALLNTKQLNRMQIHKAVGNSTFLVIDQNDSPVDSIDDRSIPIIELPEPVHFKSIDSVESVTGKISSDSWILSDDDSSTVGTAFHELAALCFDELDDKKKNRVNIKNLCSKYQLDDDAEQWLVKYAENLASSEIYQEIKNSDERYMEFGYTRKNEKGEVVSGVIDLVYRHQGKLKIVDYKTTSLGKKRPEEVVRENRYDLQLEEYAKAVEERMGEKVIERVLVFVGQGALIQVE
ncbi:MAG: UvrD-helicase domain-containing protein [Spirochaetes bacterium]|nr:UvrD-helicase domain-containing protein [Spirochaetota bacterium]